MNTSRSKLLQIETETGWKWIFCYVGNTGKIATCFDYRKALLDTGDNRAYIASKTPANLRVISPADFAEEVGENLDCFMDPADLRAHADKVRDVVPESYLHYCERKACAMENRLAGRVALACELEGDCDKLYDKIPAIWRW